jgi:hypothetical protein
VAADVASVTVVGAVRSMVIDSDEESSPAFPAASDWNDTIVHVPSASVPSVHTPATRVHVTFDEPTLVALTVPVAPTSSAVTETLIVGVLSVVTLSDDDTPVSLDESRFGTPIATGAVVSITIALAPATLLASNGTVVDVIALPTVSATEPTVKLETFKSAELWPAETVYVPVSEVPADAAVSVTVAPVSSVTVSVFPDCTLSLVVAVMFTDCVARYEPLEVVELKDVTVGAVVSRVTVTVDVTAESGPVFVLTPSARVAPFALNLGITVPSAEPAKHEDAVKV